MGADDSRENLVALAASNGVSLSQLSAMIGRNSSYLQQFVRKRSPRKLEEMDRRKLARFLGVEEARLGGSEDNSFDADFADIPRLALGASAGAGALPLEEQPIGAMRFSRRWLRRMGIDGGKLSIIAVEGDSMAATLRDGDEILVDTTPRPLRDGIHVVRVDGALLVKRIETGRPGVVVLKSDNPAYGSIGLPPGEVEIIGRVVWKGGRI